jgi:hypothetical protein
MFKKLTLIIGIALILTGIFGWQIHSFSQEPSDIDELLTGLPNFNPNDCGVDECCLTYRAAMGYVEKTWSENLNNLTDQEKPASAMVDEAFENLRTYECWLEYICRAVDYSGYASPDTVLDGGLTSKEIGKIPGCQAPEDMGLVTGWDSFVNFLKEDWSILEVIYKPEQETATFDMEFADTFFNENKIPFFPQCMSDMTNKNRTPDFVTARENYENCIAVLDSKFACKGDEESLKDCTTKSVAFVQLENALKKSNADQKARVFENKLSDIITKMLTLEFHTEYFKTKLENLNNLYECYPPKCT